MNGGENVGEDDDLQDNNEVDRDLVGGSGDHTDDIVDDDLYNVGSLDAEAPDRTEDVDHRLAQFLAQQPANA